MIFILFVLCLFLYLLINTYLVKTSEYEITASVKKEFSFVHITDVHGKIRFLNGTLSSLINRRGPDFVVVTGDLANKHSDLQPVLDELNHLVAAKGVFLVLGNYEGQEIYGLHKRNTDFNKAIEQIRRNKALTLLVNEYSMIDFKGNKVLVVGFDNSTYGRERYDKTIEDFDCDYRIMLAHSPSIIDLIDKMRITSNQVLTGHTHGGQISILKNLVLGKYSAYHTGIKKHNNTLFCISRGLGTVRIPFRMHCYPEIAFYKVKPE